MTRDEARRIVGNQPTYSIRNMARALSLHSWGNTSEDWQRLHAAVVWLGPAAPERARIILDNYLREQRT